MQKPSISSSSSSNTQSSDDAMLKRLNAFIRDKGLFGDNDRVLCLVSGGADSTAMLRMLHALGGAGEPGAPRGFSLGICHVNYGLRGEESNLDEAFVRSLGDQLGIPVHAIRAPQEKRSNFQAWARDFRYLAAQNLCRWQGYSRIAVAHNKDDRIETFLYRLVTYSGRRSLVVMPPRRGRVIRPLLFLTAEEVRGHCRARGFDWREDASNQSLDYTRNRIRQQVLPRLAEISADYRERIADTLALLEDEDEVLASLTENAWRNACETFDGQDRLLASEVSLMPRATARLVIRRWLEGAGRQVRISRRLLDSIVELCSVSSGSSSLSLADGLQVERQYDKLLLVAKPAGENAAPQPATLTVPGQAVFGDFLVEAIESPSWSLGSDDPLRVVVDGGRLDPPLHVRSWQPGDRFAPLGFQGNKSIQDLFTDEKVPRRERTGVPIVISGGAIVWVAGLRIAEAFKVTAASERLVGLRVSRRNE
ncbi:MAG: tRNA lysidine(34) synthetase TilS [Actinobacteria bacterium]|nr:tRNA lysidine(34) synthetase TilS [Actinomycetota bacterium]